MKKNTDINEWRKAGGTVKFGKTKRAKGSENILWYSLPPNLPAITEVKNQIPSHFGRGAPHWLLPDVAPTEEEIIDGTEK